MKKILLNLSKDYNLNINMYKDEGIRIFVTAGSGGGKSYATGVLCEELLLNNIPFIILDYKGEYVSLRELSESLLVIGGKYQDINYNELLLDNFLDLMFTSNISIIFDLSNFKRTERPVIGNIIMDKMYNKMEYFKKAFFFIVDEAQKFAPQTGVAESKEVLQELATTGRTFGMNLIVISQRPQLIDKNVVSQCNIQLIGQVVIDLDVNAVKRMLEDSGVDSKEVTKEIRNLDNEFYILGKEKRKIKFRLRKTQDLGKTPAFGETIEIKKISNNKLQDIIQDLHKELKNQKKKEQEKLDKLNKLEQHNKRLSKKIEEQSEEINQLNLSLKIMGNIKEVYNSNQKSIDSKSTTRIDNITKNIELDQKSLLSDIEQKDKEIKELRNKKVDLEKNITNLQENNLSKDKKIEDLSNKLDEIESFSKNIDIIKDLVIQLNDLFDISHSEENIINIQNTINEKNEQIEKLQLELNQTKQSLRTLQDNPSYTLLSNFTDKKEYLQHKAVKYTIKIAEDKANRKSGTSAINIKRILTYLLQHSEGTLIDIAKAFDLSQSTNISLASIILEDLHLITREKSDDGTLILKLDTNSLEEIIKNKIMKEDLEKSMGSIFSE